VVGVLAIGVQMDYLLQLPQTRLNSCNVCGRWVITELIQLTNQPKTEVVVTVINDAPKADSGTKVTRVVAVRTWTILDVTNWQKPRFFLSPKQPSNYDEKYVCYCWARCVNPAVLQQDMTSHINSSFSFRAPINEN
jgi:hypothetical protein